MSERRMSSVRIDQRSGMPAIRQDLPLDLINELITKPGRSTLVKLPSFFKFTLNCGMVLNNHCRSLIINSS